MQNGLPFTSREMHPSFQSLVITGALGLQASLMDIHHDTFLKSILEDDSVFSTSKARIRFCLHKGFGLWLIIRPSICFFCIAHFTFTLALRFYLGLIQPSTSNLLTCDYGHGLDVSSMHLICCPFGGQQITTHDTIQGVMYALAKESEHIIWKK
jgi:hypothetical protein